jgi:hypothetical protein
MMPACPNALPAEWSKLHTFGKLIERRTEQRPQRRGERRDRFVLSPQATTRPIATLAYQRSFGCFAFRQLVRSDYPSRQERRA